MSITYHTTIIFSKEDSIPGVTRSVPPASSEFCGTIFIVTLNITVSMKISKYKVESNSPAKSNLLYLHCAVTHSMYVGHILAGNFTQLG